MRTLIEIIAAALGLVSPLAFVVGLIILIIQAIRKKSKRPGLRLMIQAIALFALGAALYLLDFATVLIIVIGVVAILYVNQLIRKRKDAREAENRPPEPENPDNVRPLDVIHTDLNETILIRGKRIGLDALRRICCLLGSVLGVAFFWDNYLKDIFSKIERWLDKSDSIHLWYDSFAEALFDGLGETLLMALGLALIPICFYGLIWLLCGGVELTVTNRRVWGKAAFGRRVDLPLDSITAVGTGIFRSISVVAPSGAIRVMLIKNRDEIHQVLIRLLLTRQMGIPAVPAPEAAPAPVTQPPAPAQPQEQPAPQPASEPEPQTAPAPAPASQKKAAAPEAPAKPARPAISTDQPAAPAGATLGRCMLCGKTGVPVQTMNFQVGNYMRKRTVCAYCARQGR